MRIVAFGDPEGLLMKSRKSVQKIIRESNPDVVIFLGDYYRIQNSYYYKLLRYKESKSIYDLFPETILIKGIEEYTNYVFVYGNKDIRPSVLRLSKERLRNKLDNWYFVQKIRGRIKEFNIYVLNGSYTVNVDPTLEKVYNYITELKRKYNLKFLYKAPKEIRKEIMRKVKEKFGNRLFNLLFGCYITNFDNLSRIRTNEDILLTHTPPNLKNTELLFGNYPDLAIYKMVDKDIMPAYEDDPEARKENVGEIEITRFILKNNFRLVFNGHIHEGSGIALIKETNTVVINPGSISAFQNKNRIIPYVIVNLKEKNIDIYIKSWLGEKSIKI